MTGRFLLLVALRWLPTGLIIPVTVLLPLQRGLSLTQAGAIAAVQGIVVGLLKLPTGGLTDALGRKPVLVTSAVVNLASLALFAVAGSVPLFAAYYLLQGIYRALDSGPLEAWYVDHALAGDPGADIETGLSRSNVVLGAAVAGGTLLGGGLVALGPITLGPIGPVSALTVPVLAAIVINAGALACLLVLMREPRPGLGRAALIASVRGVPAAIIGAVRIARRSRVVLALLGVEALWGFGMVTFEKLLPIRLSAITGGADKASALLGPVGTAAWGACALGAALVPLLVRRAGAPWAGFVLRLTQGAAIVGMGLFAGPAGVIGAYLLCYTFHGAANPVHAALLHRQVDGPHRASLISLNSMVGQPTFSLGGIVLMALGQARGIPLAMITGAVVLAAAAPLYLVKGAAEPAPERVSAEIGPGYEQHT